MSWEDLRNLIDYGLVFCEVCLFLRAIWLTFFAEYVPGPALSALHGRIIIMDHARGTSEFGQHLVWAVATNQCLMLLLMLLYLGIYSWFV